tara:strand:- start:1375 stop:2295 length:921 start_codon:yes stop_codon:yes gene_type:complete
MKILIIGLGSIGQRHLKILLSFDNIQIAALRTSKGLLKSDILVTNFFKLEDAIKFNPDGVIITNPTSLHVISALPFLKLGCKVLIEKPIDDCFEKTEILKPYAELIRVAYCMRFNPIMKFLNSKFKVENPFKVGFKRSFYLPNWHPYADYRKEYTALKKMGGGVIRTLSHELDLAIHWFGTPESIVGVTDKVSFLEIDTDDYAFFTLKTKQQARVNFELDLYSPINIYNGEAFTQKGMYCWNLNEVKFMPYNKSKFLTLINSKNSIDEMYENQLKDFLAFLKGFKSINCNFNEARLILKLIENIDD